MRDWRRSTYLDLTVKDEVIPHVENYSDPYNCWSGLNNLYAVNNLSRILMLKKKLYNLKMPESMTMDEFFK